MLNFRGVLIVMSHAQFSIGLRAFVSQAGPTGFQEEAWPKYAKIIKLTLKTPTRSEGNFFATVHFTILSKSASKLTRDRDPGNRWQFTLPELAHASKQRADAALE